MARCQFYEIYMATRLYKLYVIGNGFDMHHGLPCGYADFRAWLQVNKPEVHRELIRLYGESSSDLWSDFEKGLSCFDLDNYPDVVTRAELMKLRNGLNEAFGEWSKTIGVPTKETFIDGLDRNAVFFTFNYTRTLEYFYGIDESRVVHLHGSVDSSNFVFGHDSLGDGVSDYALEDAREIGMDSDLYMDMVHMKMSQEYSDVFRKPVADVIERYRYDFEALAGIEEMTVLGVSYSDIDKPYFERIIEVTGGDIKVTFGHHTFWDANHALAFVEALGLCNTTLVEF